jgi:hypothetical protein
MAWEKLEKSFLIFPEPKQGPLNARSPAQLAPSDG